MAKSGFDVPRLIERFGGRARLHERLQARGHVITVKAIEKWRERGRISEGWLAELLRMAEEEGRPINLSDYTRPARADADDILA